MRLVVLVVVATSREYAGEVVPMPKKPDWARKRVEVAVRVIPSEL